MRVAVLLLLWVSSSALPTQHTDCFSCVKAGHGWCPIRRICGGFANKECFSDELDERNYERPPLHEIVSVKNLDQLLFENPKPYFGLLMFDFASLDADIENEEALAEFEALAKKMKHDTEMDFGAMDCGFADGCEKIEGGVPLPTVLIFGPRGPNGRRQVAGRLEMQISAGTLEELLQSSMQRRDVRLKELSRPVQDFCDIMFSTLVHRPGSPEYEATVQDAAGIVEKVQVSFVDEAGARQHRADEAAQLDFQQRAKIYHDIMTSILKDGIGKLADDINAIHREYAGLPIPVEERERLQVLEEFSQHFFDS